MPKGSKTCQSCNSVNGPRAYSCKSCSAPFTLKRKPSSNPVVKNTNVPTKPKRHRRTKAEMMEQKEKEFNWRDLKKGEHIKITGGGPYWAREPEDGGNIGIGYTGIFRVKYLDDEGIHAYPVGKNNEVGHCFIFMGEDKKSHSGTMMTAHKIVKVHRKTREDE